MMVLIRGHRLPGRTFCQPDGTPLPNVHVGIQERKAPVQLVPGDAESATWTFEIVLKPGPDFAGPMVQGPRGARFIYLTWGDLTVHGVFAMFRRAKLLLDRIDADLLAVAALPAAVLVADVELSDKWGHPICASLKPPFIRWSVESSEAADGSGADHPG